MTVLQSDLRKRMTLPEVQLHGDVSEGVKSEVLSEIYKDGHLSGAGSFTVGPEVKLTRLDLSCAKIHISVSNFLGMDWESTAIGLKKGGSIHVAFQDTTGAVYPMHSCRTNMAPQAAVTGVIMRHPNGHFLLQEIDGNKPKDTPLLVIPGDLSPLHKIAFASLGRSAEKQISGLGDGGGLIGTFWLDEHNNVVVLDADVSRVDMLPAAQAKALAPVIDGLSSQIEAEHEASVVTRNVMRTYLNYDAIDAVIEASSLRKTGRFLSPRPNMPDRVIFNDVVRSLALDFMNDLRERGIVEKCPNVAGRDMRVMTAWNDWIDGTLDMQDLGNPIHRGNLEFLMATPAFSAFRKVMENLDRSLPPLPSLEDARNSVLRGFERAEEMLLDPLIGQGEDPSLMDLNTGNRHILTGSILRPVLTSHDLRDSLGRYRPEDGMEDLKHLRHLKMDLPSGILIATGWMNIDGFEEGIENLVQEDFPHDRTATEKDAFARAHFERAGLAVIQTNDQHACGYVEPAENGEFLLRGSVPQGDTPRSDIEFGRETRVHVFGSAETFLDILMASNVYMDTDAAQQALCDYMRENRETCSSFPLDSNEVHIYAPTGHGLIHQSFHGAFQAEELPGRQQLTDHYVISTAELTVDPDEIDPEEWVCRPSVSEDTPAMEM